MAAAAKSKKSSAPAAQPLRLISHSELSKHNTKSDCWVAIHGLVYNLTSFLEDHPGGVQSILREGGRDGTRAFKMIHPSDMIRRLGYEQKFLVGKYDTSTAPPPPPPPAPVPAAKATAAAPPTDVKSKGTVPVLATGSGGSGASTAVVAYVKPPLGAMMNVFDMEAVAARVMKKESWDYYSSGADDELTLRENHSVFHRIWLRPRVLVNVRHVDTRSTILGFPTSLPVYLSATALARLADDDGEMALVRAARAKGVIYMLPTLSSCSLEEMLGAADIDKQTLFTQLYVNSNHAVSQDYIRRAAEGGCRALFITVDAPQLGRREKDMRHKFVSKPADVQSKSGGGEVRRDAGTARAISSFIDPALSWSDLETLRSASPELPVVLKGVQCAEDVLLAVEYGCAGVVLSNHGGRQLDTARSGVEILEEVMTALKSKGWQNRIEVYVDGGIRRGSDIFKCLALGARAVGIGRPALYGLASFGQAGVERVLDMLCDELRVCMQMMGCPSIAHIKPEMCITTDLGRHYTPTPQDKLSAATYQPLFALSKL